MAHAFNHPKHLYASHETPVDTPSIYTIMWCMGNQKHRIAGKSGVRAHCMCGCGATAVCKGMALSCYQVARRQMKREGVTWEEKVAEVKGKMERAVEDEEAGVVETKVIEGVGMCGG